MYHINAGMMLLGIHWPWFLHGKLALPLYIRCIEDLAQLLSRGHLASAPLGPYSHPVVFSLCSREDSSNATKGEGGKG